MKVTTDQNRLHGHLFEILDLTIAVTDAQFIHGVVWAGIDRQWTTGECDRNEVRERILRFCLRGLGVTPEEI